MLVYHMLYDCGLVCSMYNVFNAVCGQMCLTLLITNSPLSWPQKGRNVHFCKKAQQLAHMTFDGYLSNPDIGRTFWVG